MNIELIHGDCLQKLKDLPDNSVSSVVCDPPYGLSFMNKRWDYDVPSVEIWQECLRVLKPGGHLLAFGGSRTYHRMAVRIEDAGFQIRDQIMWLYASGFPKSHNIGKAIDKLLGNEREVVGKVREGRKTEDCYSGNLGTDADITKGQSEWEGWGTALKPSHEPIVVARKPLSEKSVALNVLKWGTGGINIDVSRVGTDGGTKKVNTDECEDSNGIYGDGLNGGTVSFVDGLGRWPANIILDEEAGQILDEQSGISKSTPYLECIRKSNVTGDNRTTKAAGMFGDGKVLKATQTYSDKGGASRFFYCPKTNSKDRDEGLDLFEEKAQRQSSGGSRDFNARCANCGKKFIGSPETICSCDNPVTDNTVFKKKNNHPTVKPTALMEYLIKLVTPVGGIVMDPFMGSGSTGKAAVRNGFDFIGIEREEEYINIAKARIENENRIYNSNVGPTE